MAPAQAALPPMGLSVTADIAVRRAQLERDLKFEAKPPCLVLTPGVDAIRPKGSITLGGQRAYQLVGGRFFGDRRKPARAGMLMGAGPSTANCPSLLRSL